MSKPFAVAGQPRLLSRDGNAPQILLAEDSAAARILTAALLRRMGCAVDEAENGEEAFDAAASSSYDVIIMDIEMPVMDGIAAARAIRALESPAASTPLVALSAFLADTAQSRHWLSLFDLIHPKPASREGLRRAVQTMLARNGTSRAVGNNLLPQSLTGNPADHLIDHEAIGMMRQQFPAADWRALITSALDEMAQGSAAIHQAHACADLAALRSHSHRVKGLARTFAAPRLARQAEQIERHAAAGTGAGLEGFRTCLDHTLTALRQLCAA